MGGREGDFPSPAEFPSQVPTGALSESEPRLK